eukprot:TRINITY_DN13819_c0_g1_i1.p1 TRINITY_DN13819_c0_g1~~TRINITY_DN13819_c0_g1_i1.p1  ORF type:complete len:359 (+),score=30.04 TRINITY_DN13819_c0_g1_i1:68-1144(+)
MNINVVSHLNNEIYTVAIECHHTASDFVHHVVGLLEYNLSDADVMFAGEEVTNQVFGCLMDGDVVEVVPSIKFVARQGLRRLGLTGDLNEHFLRYASLEYSPENTHIMSDLITCGADVLFSRPETGQTVLHYLVINENIEAIRTVFRVCVDQKLGLPTNTCDAFGVSPIHQAAATGFTEGLEVILENCVEGTVNDLTRQEPKRTALQHAVLNKRLSTMKVLLKFACDVTITDECGSTALHFAACTNSLSIIACLALRGIGIDMNASDTLGRTPLHYASERGYIESASALIRFGANPSPVCLAGKTPLHFAAIYSTGAVYEFLVSQGSDPLVKDCNGRPAAFYLEFCQQQTNSKTSGSI